MVDVVAEAMGAVVVLTLSGVDTFGLLVVLGAVVRETSDDEYGVRSACVLGSVVRGSGSANVVLISASVELVLLLVVEIALLSAGAGVLLLVWLVVAVADTSAETVDADVLLTSTIVDVVVFIVVRSTVESKTLDAVVVVTSGNVDEELLCAVVTETVLPSALVEVFLPACLVAVVADTTGVVLLLVVLEVVGGLVTEAVVKMKDLQYKWETLPQFK